MTRILIVDDEADVLTFFSAVLQQNGYETSTAQDGKQALEELRASPPDLVTLDITMPETTGVRVYKELRTDPVLKDVPVLVITGMQHEFKQFISTRRKVPPPDGYLEKPIHAEQLLAEVQRLLARRPLVS